MQDRTAARALILALRACCQHISLVWADCAYTGTLLDFAVALHISVQIVAKLAGHIGFQVLPRRWVVVAGAYPVGDEGLVVEIVR